jgi:arginase
MKRRVIIEAPSILGLDGTGVDRLGEALLAEGLAARLGATTIERVDAPPQNPMRHPAHGMLNAGSIARYSVALADAVGAVLYRGDFPIVLGGDCTILLGNLLALRRRGQFGLLFVDGHADFYQPEANVNGEGASSELAFATGRGPDVVTRFDGRDRLIADEDVVVFGFRDIDEQRQFGSQPLPPSVHAVDLASVRRLGIVSALRTAMEHLKSRRLEGFWIHFDADVLDDAIMPAVKYHLPGGLSWDEMVTVLQTALASGHAVGLQVTIYDPSQDPTRQLARALVDTIARGFAG